MARDDDYSMKVVNVGTTTFSFVMSGLVHHDLHKLN